MASEEVMSTIRPAGGGFGAGSSLTDAQREFWARLGTALGQWGWGSAACLAGAAVLQGALASSPVMLWWGVPVTVPVSAVAIALVGLRAPPQWGPVFAACVGLLADASGPALPGATAWAYLPVAVAVSLLYRRLRLDHPVTLVLYASAQAFVQIGGSYIGLRLVRASGTAGHIAVATVLFSTIMAILAAAGTALTLRFYAALQAQTRRGS